MKRIVNLYKRIFWSNEKLALSQGVKIGKDCNIQNVNFGSEPYLIEIGDNVQITNGTKIFTHGGSWVLRKKYSKFDFFGKVIIKNNVYIGNNSLIMPGVTIESNVIVAAGSVVVKSVPANSIVGGNPARIISNIKDFEERMLQFNLKSKDLSKSDKKTLLLSLQDDMFIKK